MVSVVLTSIGIFSINISKRLEQSDSHPSSASRIFNFSGLVKNPLLNEYFTILAHTIIFGTLLYFTLSTLSYIIFFLLNKKKYLPGLKTDEFKIYHDIKNEKESIRFIFNNDCLNSVLFDMILTHKIRKCRGN